MLDPKFVRENPEDVKKGLKDRNSKIVLDGFFEMDAKRRELIAQVEDLKREKKESSKKIGMLIREKKDAEAQKAEVNLITGKIDELDNILNEVEGKFHDFLDTIPNIPHKSVPVGSSEKDNKLVREEGSVAKLSFKPKDHIELGKINGILDLERSAKISGSGFPLSMGSGARLERALINFMLDVHTREHGYTEVMPPFLVTRKSMRGTGQLPKLEEDMYKVDGEDMFLIPTAEVPVTNLHSGEVLHETDLPLCYTAQTACFRKEAGSYGKDTRGIIRVHQFNKVELVKFVRPENSMSELEKLLADAEDILKRLELPYRVLELCTADISFAAHKCYDIELWAPGLEKWLEVSSCSAFSDFQARRARIKYQPKDGKIKPVFVHTLNGSGVALPRLVIAILETNQREDGSIGIPEKLVPYFGEEEIRTAT